MLYNANFLYREIEASESTASQHLARLKKAGMITGSSAAQY
ncbi:ArsR family transcriptional regulator [Heyndrickxia sp. MSNUG]